jgi:tetratricopeptide (TPR) repeat protein
MWTTSVLLLATYTVLVRGWTRGSEDTTLLSSLVALRSPQQSADGLRRYLERQPLDGLAHYYLAGRLKEFGGMANQHSALDAYHKAVALLADGAERALALRDLAKAYKTMQDDKITALRYVQESLLIEPSSIDAHVSAGELFLDLGEAESSLRHFMTAVGLAQPATLPAHSLAVGEVFRSVGDYDTAAEVLAQCFQSCSWPLEPDKRGLAQAMVLRAAAAAAARLNRSDFEVLGERALGAAVWQRLRKTWAKDEQDQLVRRAMVGEQGRSAEQWRQLLRPIYLVPAMHPPPSGLAPALWSHRCLLAIRQLRFPLACGADLELWMLNASATFHSEAFFPSDNALMDPVSCLNAYVAIFALRVCVLVSRALLNSHLLPPLALLNSHLLPPLGPCSRRKTVASHRLPLERCWQHLCPSSTLSTPLSTLAHGDCGLGSSPLTGWPITP